MNRDLPNGVLRGQMYYANLDPVVGSEQGGNRPVLVIQNNVGNRHSPTIIIAPITTRVKKLHQPTHIGVPPYFGLPQNSMAMLEQIRTIDKGRLGSCFTTWGRYSRTTPCRLPHRRDMVWTESCSERSGRRRSSWATSRVTMKISS